MKAAQQQQKTTREETEYAKKTCMQIIFAHLNNNKNNAVRHNEYTFRTQRTPCKMQ